MDIDQELLEKLTSQIKTQDDLAGLSRQLLKHAVERVMVTELEEHPNTTVTGITLETTVTATPARRSR